jgi:hypothetical protein
MISSTQPPIFDKFFTSSGSVTFHRVEILPEKSMMQPDFPPNIGYVLPGLLYGGSYER